jgi:hypothetical protein
MQQDREKNSAGRKARRASARDIGPIPPCKNPQRRGRYARNLLGFLSKYFPQRFPLAFSGDHKLMIERLQTAILEGGQFAVAMPRGSGKTTVCECACIWAMLYGHRRFLFVIAADADAAELVCSSIKEELDNNEALSDDFPDAVYPITVLEGISRRAEGQTSEGVRTMLLWTKTTVRLPRSAAGGGSVIRTAGITGRIRGAKCSLADGSQVRPDIVLVDDPQTDESARSVSQVAARLRTLTGTVLGLAGPGQRIAALTTCTVIDKGDLADQILDRKEHPEWQGFKARLMHTMPTNQKLWDEYFEIYKEDMRLGFGMKRATAFYRANRAAMDAGAIPSWRERYERPERGKKHTPGLAELSAIQHAMNLLLKRGHATFMAEYQNEPMDPLASSEVEQVTAAAVLRQASGLDKGIAPIESTILTAGIDVQEKCLYWSTMAWTQSFDGDCIAYGTYPDQGRPHFTYREVEKTLAKAHPGGSWEASLYAALESLVGILAGREWARDDGGVMRLDQIVIDAGYGNSTDTVYQFCRRSAHASILLPYFGRTIAAGAPSMDEWKKKPGDRVGPGWRIPKPRQRQTRHILADANAWKSFVADRLLTRIGDAGCLTLYGTKDQVSQHRMIADQLSSEIRTRVTANGRTTDEWKLRPNRDNHWFDTWTMAAIGASIRGAKLDEQVAIRAAHRQAAALIAADPMAPQTPAPAQPQKPPLPPPRRPSNGGWLTGFGGGL